MALLCVQHNSDDRPNMSDVITMLSGEGQLPDPQQPGFYAEKDGKFGPETTYGRQTQSSKDDTTFVIVESR